MPSLKDIATHDIEQEFVRTRQVLERVPDEHLDWKPHDKSFSLGALATHVANLVWWMTMTLAEDHYDLAASPGPAPALESRDAILADFDRKVAEFRNELDLHDDASIQKPWALRHGDAEIFSRPKFEVLREWGVSHTVHHRGQLTVYLRMKDVPLPPIYGPTADEQMGG